jgi:hypothetical protein
MLKQMVIVGVLLGVGMFGCERRAQEPAAPPPEEPRDEMITPAPTPPPERPVTPPPQEPAVPEEPMAEPPPEEPAEPPTGQEVGVGEPTDEDMQARTLIESASDPTEGDTVTQEAAQDQRLTGTWVSQDRETAQGAVQDRITFRDQDGQRIMTWSSQMDQEQVDAEREAPPAPPPPLAQGMSAEYWFDDEGHLVLQYGPQRDLLRFRPDSPEAQAAVR